MPPRSDIVIFRPGLLGCPGDCRIRTQTGSGQRWPVPGFRRVRLGGGKNTWGDTGDLEPADSQAGITEFDFRAGGRERFGVKMAGTTYRYDARYYDIVPDQRIIYAYEMYAGDARISVSVATIEFAKNGDGTALTWTEQGTYLDGIDGPEASALRKGGTTEMLDGLTRYLATQTAP